MISKSAKRTQEIAKDFAKKILKNPYNRSGAFVIALKGDLGGGKTTFLQGFAAGLGVKEKILSPTFNIYKKYKIKNELNLVYFYHFDCYRIEKPKEVLNLGFKKIISNSQNIVAVEWAEKIKDILPSSTQWINFDFINKTARAINFL